MSKEKKKKVLSLANTYPTLLKQIRRDKKPFVVYLVLQALILGIVLFSIFTARWGNVFTGVLAALLLLLPPFIEHSFHVRLPATLEILAYIFVFSAQILGEIADFYTLIPIWDAILHTFNGFMFAAFGFCLVDIFNKTERFRFELSPFFLALTAFCFSMTVGVLWEFFEFAADHVLLTDMQKDAWVSAIHSVSLPNALGEKVTHIKGIASTRIVLESGEVITLQGGYLDLGLIDTIEDLFVNFIGAILFCTFGYIYVKKRGNSYIAKQFIPKWEKKPSPAALPPSETDSEAEAEEPERKEL